MIDAFPLSIRVAEFETELPHVEPINLSASKLLWVVRPSQALPCEGRIRLSMTKPKTVIGEVKGQAG